MKENISQSISDKLNKIIDTFPQFTTILRNSENTEEARQKLLLLSYELEENIQSEHCEIHPLERIVIKESLNVFKNFLSRRSEKISNHSFLKTLFEAIQGNEDILKSISQGFIDELYHLIKGLLGQSGVYTTIQSNGIENEPRYLKLTGREAAIARCEFLDELSVQASNYIERYPSGLTKDIIQKRKKNVKRILDFFNATKEDWIDYSWHLRHIIRDLETVKSLIDLSDDEEKAVDIANRNHIPFGITPYYLSLMDKESGGRYDHAVRAQVIPPLSYVQRFQNTDKKKMDFMREKDTSPIDLVTRRYPMIAILKPFNTCAQICVYCQRNWEIDDVNSQNALASPNKIDAAIEWFKNNKSIKAVLLTGGDPLILSDEKLDELLGRISDIPHIERIRIGTRTPVVLPFRFTKSLIKILKSYHLPGKREICIVTHFEHPYEITPDANKAVQKVKQKTSINFYNQQVFTIENCRKFETVTLRRNLKNIGIDPYYIFHAKGKKETEYYIVPIARLLQERKEEARLTPGVVRTDEPVYNIPGTGKNHLRAMQDHELIMITPQGRRIYEMHPWEKAIVTSNTYIYEDVSITDFLSRLAKHGEDINDYKSIWYYY
jgi:lysine 2,3-aminomutase